MIKRLFTNQHRAAGVFICLLCACLYSHGQVWNKTYLGGRPIMVFSSIVSEGDSFTLTGVTHGTNGLVKSFLGTINASGVLDKVLVVNDTDVFAYKVFCNSLLRTQTGYAFTGYAYDTAKYLILGVADTLLGNVRVFKYYTPNAFAFQGFGLILKNGNYYISGVLTDDATADANVFLVKIDSAGNRLWQKKYGLTNWQESGLSLAELNNNHLMIGAERQNPSNVREIANTWLIEVDTNGNVARQWLDNSDSTYAAYGLRQTPDGGFVYGCQKKAIQITSTIAYENTITKLRPNFTKQFVYTEGYRSVYNSVTDVDLTPDGDIIACGHNFSLFYDTAILYGWVIKMDMQGNRIWSNYYTTSNAINTLNFLYDVDVLPGGDIIAVGECQPSTGAYPQLGWFLKLNSEGCELESCLVGIDDIQASVTNAVKINLYPNPAQGSITFDYENMPEDSRLVVADLVGQVITTLPVENDYGTITLNTGSYPNGVYLVSAEADGKVLLKQKFIVLK